MNAQCVRFGHFRQAELQNTIPQCRCYVVRLDFGGQVNRAEDLVAATLRPSLALLLLFLGFSFAGNRQPTWLHADFDFFFVEAWHFCFHLERSVCFGNVH